MSASFCHLHCHTTYSLLDGAANISALLRQAKLLGMDAVAITDHGNMFGVPQFVNAAKREGLKPIIGCELYIAADMHDRKDKRRYHQLLLAKNAIGYKNLMKLCSLGFTEGYYYKPRVDRKTIAKYKEGLIATTCCLAAEVPRAILDEGEGVAEAIFLDWLSIFGEDYYIELQRHGIPQQDRCNEVLIRWGKKYHVKLIATNDVHYIKREDSRAQDIMLCLQMGKNLDDPNRMRFTGHQFYLKSPKEMLTLFSDLPEAIHNTLEVADKITTPTLKRDLLMPIFQIPEQFATQDDYLDHLTFSFARKRYGSIEIVLEKRLNYELQVIRKMGFSGYFLIVQDMVDAAKQLGVCVGPGRGSVAGSAVAYALGITDVEPISYKLLFERFLNPERISMPDIDIDFDDEGRQKVINYLVQKYGYEQVAHIITFNAMAAKSAIRDVSRVVGLPLAKADALAKLVPDRPGTTLAQAFATVPALNAFLKNKDTPESNVLSISKILEHSPRHTGIHAAGVIIAPQKLVDLIPVKTDKSTNLLVSQYDGSMIEDVGLLKMDLLGLKTLSIIRDALRLIKETHGKKIDIGNIPLDDKKTLELYQKGNTVGVFQFESEGMRNYLQKLHPTQLEHLIAMNALYRPGPMQNIPSYIARMHGREQIDYMHPLLKEVLESTYGIPVYQEQIMRIAQVIGGYSLEQADLLRRVMGKKKKLEMQKQEVTFLKGAKEQHQISEKHAKTIFDTMSHFAEYGFNRSHSVAYTLLSYQTAYLKAHYATAYMASILIHNQSNMDKIAFFIEECTRLKLQVKGPHINRSAPQFRNDGENTIRFGLAAVKGIGSKAVVSLIEERKTHGDFKDIHDVVHRIMAANGGRTPNKKILETLASSGAFDSFQCGHRKQYVHVEEGQPSFVEQVLQYEQKRYKEKKSSQQLLFGHTPDLQYGKAPTMPTCTPYSKLETLKIEKELVGFYISGHPMKEYELEIKHFSNANSQSITMKKKKADLYLGGMVLQLNDRQNSKGNQFGILSIEDSQGTLDIMLFGEVYHQYRHLLIPDQMVYIKGKMQPRYGREDQLDFRPYCIEPLKTVLQRYTKRVDLQIAMDTITPSFVDDMVALFKQYQGTCTLHLHLPYMKGPVPTLVKNYRITPSKPLFKALDRLNVHYKLHA